MKDVRSVLSLLMAATLVAPTGVFAASHREAPITALDRAADITDYYSFVSYEDPSKVVFIMSVDPLLEPSNGPTYFPFDPGVVYRINVDRTFDAVEDVSFEFRFTTVYNAPTLFTAYAGAGNGLNAPANAPLSNPGTPGQSSPTSGQAVIPPQITSLTGAGAGGLNLMQTYTVTMVTGSGSAATRTNMGTGQTLIAVPTYVGVRTMGTPAQYNALARQGIFTLPIGSFLPGQNPQTVRVFAGTTDDPFYIDLGAAFDSLNFRPGAFFGGGTSAAGVPLPVLLPTQDLNDTTNFAPDAVSGFNVNTIAIEVPISMVTSPGNPVIGSWATTSRLRTQVRPPAANAPTPGPGDFAQVQRMANPLINELIIGIGSKDAWSTSVPSKDMQFANFGLDPLLARVLNTVFGLSVPDPPRLDLAPLVVYAPPITAKGAAPAILTAANPFADLLRLNTSIPATAAASRKRLGFIAGDSAGYPNGRRITDDVTDISLRAVAGALCGSTAACTSAGLPFSGSSVPALGDGVNINDVPTQEVFPYVPFAHSGRDSRHVSAGETVCAPNCPQ
ncbi:MAG: DUF4331 domain-containing protein [Acidobacteriota bacterium]|nr:DUF4331 domain-containing protein [Acidobacteriota bacterium]